MTQKGSMLLLVVAVVMLALSALWAQSRTSGTTVTRTQRLEVVDKDGRIRAEVKAIGDDTVLALYDGRGRLRTLVSTDSIVFYSADGKIAKKVDARQAEDGAGQP